MIIIRPRDIPPNPFNTILWGTEEIQWGDGALAWGVKEGAVLSASNVPATDPGEDEWDSGTTYSQGDIVTVLGTTQRRFESVDDNNEDNFPPDSPNDWLDLGATNRWRMFDDGTSTLTSNPELIEISIQIPAEQLADGIAFFGLDAGAVEIEVSDENGALYQKEREFLIGVSESNWWSYFFGSVLGFQDPTQDIVALALPTVFGATIRIKIKRETGIARCGLIVVGRQQQLATSIYGSSVGIRDFSIKEADAFGNFTVVERRFVKRAEVDLIMDTNQVSGIQRALANRRATPTVYIGSKAADPFEFENTIHEELILYGYYSDFDLVLTDANTTRGTIDIEGL